MPMELASKQEQEDCDWEPNVKSLARGFSSSGTSPELSHVNFGGAGVLYRCLNHGRSNPDS